MVVNNTLGSKTVTQCINVTDTGFAITQLGPKPDNGQVGYPSLYLGCHYGLCSPAGGLPIQVGHISSATSSISYSYVDDGNYDAMYDIYLDPTQERTAKIRWRSSSYSITKVLAAGDLAHKKRSAQPRLAGVAGRFGNGATSGPRLAMPTMWLRM